MRRKPRGEPKFTKAKKEYSCLICEKKIKRGTRHIVFSHSSPYLRKAWEKLTKFYPQEKIVETFISLRFCSGRCYRFWLRLYKTNYEGYTSIWKKVHKLEVEALKRRAEGWKQWKIWKEILDPLRGYRVPKDEKD